MDELHSNPTTSKILEPKQSPDSRFYDDWRDSEVPKVKTEVGGRDVQTEDSLPIPNTGFDGNDGNSMEYAKVEFTPSSNKDPVPGSSNNNANNDVMLNEDTQSSTSSSSSSSKGTLVTCSDPNCSRSCSSFGSSSSSGSSKSEAGSDSSSSSSTENSEDDDEKYKATEMKERKPNVDLNLRLGHKSCGKSSSKIKKEPQSIKEEGESNDEGEELVEQDEGETRLPPKRKSARVQAKATFCEKKYESEILKKLTALLKKSPDELSAEDHVTLSSFPKLANEAEKRLQRRHVATERLKEFEDDRDILEQKCQLLATAIRSSKYLTIYTGAGISTSAQIPDYRGPNGIWTLLRQGQSLEDCITDSPQQVLASADPTLTHMAMKELYQRGIIKHIVSQNCDGLHVRSGIPKTALSEVHGNMYIEVCLHCAREYVRRFDVTENTRRHQHRTGRHCYHCGSPLRDTVVHFGERGFLRWPLNWTGAEYHANRADTIVCLGSSLKVLRRYPWLWAMDRPCNKRPKLLIVNLQWTPKDQYATLKIHGKCDEVMNRVMELLKLPIPTYKRETDPIFTISTNLHPSEEISKTSQELSFPEGMLPPRCQKDANNYFKFDSVFKVQPNMDNVSSSSDEDDKKPNGEIDAATVIKREAKKLRKKKNKLKGKQGTGWLGNAWGVKPKKRKLK